MNNNISIFNQEIKNSILFHIPHASSKIPYAENYPDWLLAIYEKDLVTDIDVEKIFDIPKIKKIKANFSRIFCDVERMLDRVEPLFERGRGFFYTKTDKGELLRNDEFKSFVLKNYYLKHHAKLEKAVEKKLNENDVVYIIDCHTFNDIPLNTDLDKTMPRPDICLGTNDFHTPQFLTNYIKHSFEKNGYSVAINTPYKDTIVPLKFLKNDKRVNSIMIEINKRLYMTDSGENDIKKLNSIIKEIFNFY